MFPNSCLFKYCSVSGLHGILRNQGFLVKSPSRFNDPFEVRPFFDDARKKRFDEGRRAIYSKALPSYRSELENISVDDIVDFDTRLNEQLVRYLEREYRVLCLTRLPADMIMWAHYAHNHTGFCIGIDPEHANFFAGMNREGFNVQYLHDRRTLTMPESFYGFLDFDIEGRPVINGSQMVESDGVIISAEQRSQKYEAALLRIITHKYEKWGYEEEVRFIYKISESQSPSFNSPFDLLLTPPDSIAAVIVGYSTPKQNVAELLTIYEEGRFPNLKLYYTDFHPYEYKMRIHAADPHYLKDLYSSFRGGANQ